MRLYYSPGACSLAPHIVAREVGVPIELVRVDLATKTTENGEDFLTINPKGSFPTLAFADGTVLTEGAVISQFLADKAPGAGLLPAHGTFGRYRALEWLNFVATELHKSFSPLWRKDTPTEMRTILKQIVGTKLSYLDRHLASQDYLLGDSFGAADAYAFAILSWAPIVGIDFAQWPNTAAYVERIFARPSVRAALAAEGLLKNKAA
jgi:glutathione S-transferase